MNWDTEQDGTYRIPHPSTTEHKTDALTASATEVCRNELSHFEHRDLIFFNFSPFVSNIPTTAILAPAALPMFASGLAGLGALYWRRKRKQTA